MGTNGSEDYRGGGVRISLGCGEKDKGEGWVHVDRVAHGAHVDVVHDLDVRPWPFEDGCAERIEAVDVLEHLEDTVGFFDECWRVLAAGGRLVVQTVHYESANCWRDPTHKRGYHPDVFYFFDPASGWYQTTGKLYTERTWRVVAVVCDEAGNIGAEMVKIG
jgi:SAM-dependent methyltransferase